MAALVADITRVDKLTEQFGRQRLEEGLAFGAKSLDSQLAANNNAGDVTFTKQHSAWLICQRSPARGKLERRTGQANKTFGVSRNLPHLSHRRSPPLFSEVRIIKVGGNKRVIKRDQRANPSKQEDDGELDREKLCVALREGNEGLDLSSSSDDELRELYSFKTEPLETKCQAGNVDNAEIHPTRLLCSVKDPSDKDPRRLKRNKIYRGSLKKKIKISRPSLDLEKMLARRVEDTGSDKGTENIFHPIDQM